MTATKDALNSNNHSLYSTKFGGEALAPVFNVQG